MVRNTGIWTDLSWFRWVAGTYMTKHGWSLFLFVAFCIRNPLQESKRICVDIRL